VFEPIKRQARRHLLDEFLSQKILIEDLRMVGFSSLVPAAANTLMERGLVE
jgi:hypothetical protein